LLRSRSTIRACARTPLNTFVYKKVRILRLIQPGPQIGARRSSIGVIDWNLLKSSWTLTGRLQPHLLFIATSRRHRSGLDFPIPRNALLHRADAGTSVINRRTRRLKQITGRAQHRTRGNKRLAKYDYDRGEVLYVVHIAGSSHTPRSSAARPC